MAKKKTLLTPTNLVVAGVVGVGGWFAWKRWGAPFFAKKKDPPKQGSTSSVKPPTAVAPAGGSNVGTGRSGRSGSTLGDVARVALQNLPLPWGNRGRNEPGNPGGLGGPSGVLGSGFNPLGPNSPFNPLGGNRPA